MGVRVGIASLGALLAVVLQVVLAPNIAIFGVMPNFVVAYCLAMALLVPAVPSYLIVFVCGMIVDLLGYGPVGVWPFLLLLGVFALQRAHASFGNDTLFVSLIILALFAFVVPLFHTAFMVATTSTYTALEAFGQQGLPLAIYNCVLALLTYPLLSRVLGTGDGRLSAISTGTHLQ